MSQKLFLYGLVLILLILKKDKSYPFFVNKYTLVPKKKNLRDNLPDQNVLKPCLKYQ